MKISRMLTLKLILFFVCFIQYSFANRYNVSFSDLQACREYRIESGYVYRDFFVLNNLENNRLENETLRLQFYVMAPSNAHILLSPVDNAKKDDRVYEIVVGAGSNTFATIRSRISGIQVAVKKQNGILNAIYATPIIVVQKIDGTIEVTIPTFASPFLSYKDPTPLTIKYVSLSSYGSTTARWFYDCKGDKAARMEMEERNLTSIERLEKDLFSNYSMYTVPDGLSKILMGARIKAVSYKSKKSVFETRLELKMKWNDKKLKWNPLDYGNTSLIRGFESYAWSPSMLVMNGADSSFTNFDPEYYGTITNNGSVEAYTKQKTIKTWCKEPENQNWPWDELKCSIELILDAKGVKLAFDPEYGIRTANMTESTEWRYSSYDLFEYNMQNLSRFDGRVQELETSPSGLTLVIHLRRNILFYRKVFFTPLIAAAILILLSFAMKRFLRSILILTALIMLLGTFVMLTNHTPVTYVPRIVHIYETFLGIACFSYALSILNRWMTDYQMEEKPCGCLLAIINNSTLRYVLGLQFADASEYLDIQHNPWKQVSLILDRVVFVVLFFTFSFILFIGFK